MKKISLLLILNSSFLAGFSQFLNPDDFDDHVLQRFDAAVYDASGLFDSTEIKNRRIKSAALLQTYEGITAADTVYIYYFDTTGKVVAQVYFTPPSGDADGDSYVRDKVCDINSFNKIRSAQDSAAKIVFVKSTDDSTVNAYYIYMYPDGVDTSIRVTIKYNGLGQIIERKKEISDRYKQQAPGNANMAMHYKFRYDDSGRIVYRESVDRNRYTLINYTQYGVERKSYNSDNNEMLDSELIISLNCGDVYIQTNDRSELIAYKLEEGSALISRLVSIQIDESYYATHYAIKYSMR